MSCKACFLALKEKNKVIEKTSWYLKVAPSDCAPYAILVGDPARQSLFAAQMDNVREVAQDREFKTITGIYSGTPIMVVTVGIGAPSAVLTLEELWELGVKVVVRAGTGMSLGIPLGDFILAQAATRNEGTSISYLPVNFPAVPDIDLFHSFFHTLKKEKAPVSSGVIMTCDGFYTDMFNHSVSGRQPARSARTLMDEYRAYGIISADMETSALYIAGQFLGMKVLTLLVATVDGREQLMLEAEIRQFKEKELARLALEGIHQYALKVEK
jgi:uridine phosphorylase